MTAPSDSIHLSIKTLRPNIDILDAEVQEPAAPGQNKPKEAPKAKGKDQAKKANNKEPVVEVESEMPILTHQKLFEILDEPSITFEPTDSQMETADFTQEQSKGIGTC